MGSRTLSLGSVIAGYGYGDVLKGVDLEVERGSVTCNVETALCAVDADQRPAAAASRNDQL